MKSYKFFVAAISVLILIIALPAYAEVRTFSGDLTDMSEPMGLFNDANIDILSELSGSVTFDLNTMSKTWREEIDDFYYYYIDDSNIQISMMLGTLSFSQNDAASTTKLYFDESNNLIGIDFCTPYIEFGDNSYTFISDDNNRFASFDIFAQNSNGLSNGTNLKGTYNFTPVPIPSAILLLGSGLMGVAGLKRKIGKA